MTRGGGGGIRILKDKRSRPRCPVPSLFAWLTATPLRGARRGSRVRAAVALAQRAFRPAPRGGFGRRQQKHHPAAAKCRVAPEKTGEGDFATQLEA